MNMSAVDTCKQAGLKGLCELSEHSQVSRRTLYHWHESRPTVFRLLILGVLQAKLGRVAEWIT